MGFFSDLKEDLSQAVNELMPMSDMPQDVPEEAEVLPEPEEAAAENVSLEEMLENIDNIQLPEDMGIEESLTAEPESAAEIPAEDATETAAETSWGSFVSAEETAGEPAPEETADDVTWEPVSFAEAEEVAEVSEPAVETVEVVAEDVAAEPAEEVPAQEPAAEAEPEPASEEAATEVPVAWELRREIEQKNSEKESKGAEKKMDNMTGRQASDETAIITSGMEINGDINSEGSIDLVGTVCGNIEILGKLNVTGHINGNSKAAEIYAEGAKINGEIVSEGAVKIGASSVIIGNITATSAAIAGAVKGDIDVKGPVILDASAIVMGNIKSKSVQINNGAVIEGMCSQCYADVSPTSFFDEYKPEIKSSKKSK